MCGTSESPHLRNIAKPTLIIKRVKNSRRKAKSLTKRMIGKKMKHNSKNTIITCRNKIEMKVITEKE